MYDKLYQSLKLLEEQHTRLNNTTNTELEPWVIEAIKESCIQRFETCWDSLGYGIKIGKKAHTLVSNLRSYTGQNHVDAHTGLTILFFLTCL